MRIFTVLIVCLIFLVGLQGCSPAPVSGYQQMVNNAIKSYHDQGIDYRKNLIDYQSLGSYLNFEDTCVFSDGGIMCLDAQGIPQILYGDAYYYNPVTICQYILYRYGQYLKGAADFSNIEIAIDKLLSMQDEDGAFRYPFAWRYYIKPYEPGWVSGMAQGEALSVLYRAYAVTKDIRYLDAGNKALGFLLTPVSLNGVLDTMDDVDPSLQDKIMFEEYPVTPGSHTLNGFMFALLGCYDWWQLNPDANDGPSKIAGDAFAKGIETLDAVLHYYDIGGFSTYDLGYIIYSAKPYISPPYHAIHIYLLHALHFITGDATLGHFEQLWASYVDDSASKTLMKSSMGVAPQVNCGM